MAHFPTRCGFALLVLVMLGMTQASSWAGPAKIDARLIYGSNTDDQPKEAALQDIEPKFKPDFGYKHYRLLGEKNASINDGESAVMDLGHQFQITVKNKETKKPYHVLQIDLYHQGKKLLFIEVSVEQKSEPIFIKGPWTDQGLVIIALTAK